MPTPQVTLVVAWAHDRVIGHHGALPWHLPADLAHFKHVTLGKPVIMGRKTWDSILARNGKPLPGRRNIVVSRQPAAVTAGGEAVGSLADALARCADVPEVCVIGGAQLYAEALPLAHRVVATEIDLAVAGDAFMPPLDPSQWRECAREHHAPAAPRRFGFDFVTYERR